jgi:lysophospholipase L1-like esterase
LCKDFKCLGKKDVIVINGGVNDIGSKRNQTNGVLVKTAQFMQKHNNTNIIVVKYIGVRVGSIVYMKRLGIKEAVRAKMAVVTRLLCFSFV